MATVVDTHKHCSRCHVEHPLTEFYVRRASADGRQPFCRTCARTRSKGYRDRYRDQNHLPAERADLLVCRVCGEEKSRENFPSNSGKRTGAGDACKPCQAAAYKSWWAGLSPRQRRAYGLRRFGLTPEGYDTLLAAQGGGCAICSTRDPGGRWGTHFAVDHDHDSGSVRGLLCSRCNVMLGNAKDDPERLRAAASYLESC